jgi:hypothetical protein
VSRGQSSRSGRSKIPPVSAKRMKEPDKPVFATSYAHDHRDGTIYVRGRLVRHATADAEHRERRAVGIGLFDWIGGPAHHKCFIGASAVRPSSRLKC